MDLYVCNSKVEPVWLCSSTGHESSLFRRPTLSSLPPQALTAPSRKVYRPINLNHYATKKSAAQSMLDVALLMANSSQLKTVIYVGPQYRFYIPLIVLLSVSITLQVVVGLVLVFIGKWLGCFVYSKCYCSSFSIFLTLKYVFWQIKRRRSKLRPAISALVFLYVSCFPS